MIDFNKAITNRTLWLLDAGDRLHLAMEPQRGVDPRKSGYLVLPSNTPLVIKSVKDVTNVVCKIGSHTVMIDSIWMTHVVL